MAVPAVDLVVLGSLAFRCRDNDSYIVDGALEAACHFNYLFSDRARVYLFAIELFAIESLSLHM